MPKIEVSLGEFIDKYTILKIKEERIKDEAKLKHIKVEIKSLLRNLNSDEEHLLSKTLPNELISELKTVNEKLWDTEDVIRKCERENKFDEEFIEHARLDAKLNDQRFLIKNKINNRGDSLIKEQKSYDGLYTPDSTLD
tara:strand:- start:308 stop:724 length:417 start_codon:yes stop_codon:yes gene_type:complete